eukprot:1261674-Amphidinium_carterae.1
MGVWSGMTDAIRTEPCPGEDSSRGSLASPFWIVADSLHKVRIGGDKTRKTTEQKELGHRVYIRV